MLYWNRVNRSFHEMNFEDFPVLYSESSLHMARKGLTGLRITGILEVVVADWKLRIRLLHIRAIHNTNVAASENWTFVRVAGNGKLGQVQVELFPQVHRKDK